MMMVLTGGLAAGKSTVAKFLEQHGAQIIDTDQIAKKLLEPFSPCFKEVLAHFGPPVLNPDRSLDRKKLRQKIFEHPQDRLWLENLLHPEIQRIVLEETQKAQAKFKVIVVPLFRSKKNYPADLVLSVECPEKEQIQRVMKRDLISESLAKKMIAAQPSSEERQALADEVIWNTGTPQELEKNVSKFLTSLGDFLQ